MATLNSKLQPLFVAGKMPKDCYDDINELVSDLAKVLQFPEDSISVIKGAKGDKGDKGEKGVQGVQGPDGTGITKQVTSVVIPEGESYVEFDIFQNWQQAIYTVWFNGTVGGSGAVLNPDHIMSIATIVPVHASPSPTKLRCYFIFKDGETVSQDEDHMLQITRFV